MPKRIIDYIKKIDVEEEGGEEYYKVKITLTNNKTFVFPVAYPIIVGAGYWKHQPH